MGRRLAGTVALLNPETFRTEVFGPGATVPAWAAARITNPGLWDPETARTEHVHAEWPTEPPRAGKGSSRAAWATYADTIGVTVADDATRDDIIAAVDAQEG